MITIAGSPCGGLGISIVRGGALVVAAGAITRVPLGDHVTARFPFDDILEAEAVFRRRDDKFRFPRLPIEIEAEEQIRTVLAGGPSISQYRFFVVRSFARGIPGTDESLALWHPRFCPDVAAIATAQLLALWSVRISLSGEI